MILINNRSRSSLVEEAPDQEMRSSPLGLSVVTRGHVTLLGISVALSQFRCVALFGAGYHYSHVTDQETHALKGE